MSANLLTIDSLNIAFDGKKVVNDVSFSIAAGEKLALVGESGSGKSVIAMSLLRLVPDAQLAGHVHFDGVELTALPDAALQAVRGRDIAMIFQEPMTALNPLYTVGEQIAEVYRVKHGLDARAAWQKAVERLAETEIPEPHRRAKSYPHQLSGGQRQRAMIAMALASEPRLLIADEPTTALDVTLRLQILDLLGSLQRAKGMAVLMITHDLQLVRRFADKVVVLQHGNVVEQGAVSQVFATPQNGYTRKLLASRPTRGVLEVDFSAPELPGIEHVTPVIRAEAIGVNYRVPAFRFKDLFKPQRFSALQSVSFELLKGRTLGVIGESGSGKSTLAQAVLGMLAHTGKIQVCGQTWQQAKQQGFEAQKALRRRIQVVFQDPYASLSPRMKILDIVGEGLAFREPSLSASDRHLKVQAMLEAVGLTEQQFPGLLARYPHEFSGGQRQRIAIARALITHPDVLVLDEPTSALDVTIQKQVLALLQSLQKQLGLSYLLITHDMDVIHAMAHDVIVMKDGLMVEVGSVHQVLHAPRQAYTKALIAASGLGQVASSDQDTARQDQSNQLHPTTNGSELAAA